MTGAGLGEVPSDSCTPWSSHTEQRQREASALEQMTIACA